MKDWLAAFPVSFETNHLAEDILGRLKNQFQLMRRLNGMRLQTSEEAL